PKDLVPVEEIATFVAHPIAETFPMINNDELRELADDIRKNGMLEPITLFEGKILDGRNRLAAGKLINFPFRRINFRQLLCHLDPQAYVISANIKRRHLTAEQKRELIAKLIKAEPSKSNRQIAETAKVSHHTVGDVRTELETTGQIAQSETMTGADGRARSASRRSRGGSSSNPSDLYDKAEESLIKKLQALSVAEAEAAAKETIKLLNSTVTTMKAGAKSAKAA